jgi:hypothetical protein
LTAGKGVYTVKIGMSVSKSATLMPILPIACKMSEVLSEGKDFKEEIIPMIPPSALPAFQL